jgi:protein farnesyltransferase/geranylgeranyltransferase type-1 subunit alpha
LFLQLIERGKCGPGEAHLRPTTMPWFWSIAFSTLHLLRAILHQLHIVRSLPRKKERMPKYYHDDDAWQDIEPLPQDDGGLHPLAAIAYTEEYSEAMGYLRAVMAKNEFSERVMGLTEHIISMNPAHYTVW